MMAPALLSSTTLPAVWFLALVTALFWFVREWAQKGRLSDWSVWKIAEAAAPAATAFLCAGGVTVWRLTHVQP